MYDQRVPDYIRAADMATKAGIGLLGWCHSVKRARSAHYQVLCMFSLACVVLLLRTYQEHSERNVTSGTWSQHDVEAGTKFTGEGVETAQTKNLRQGNLVRLEGRLTWLEGRLVWLEGRLEWLEGRLAWL